MRPKWATTSAASVSVEAGIGDVDRIGPAASTVRLQQPGRLRRAGHVDVGDGNAGTLRGEQDGRGAADPRARSGDEADLVGETHERDLCGWNARTIPRLGSPATACGIIAARDAPGCAPATAARDHPMTIFRRRRPGTDVPIRGQTPRSRRR